MGVGDHLLEPLTRREREILRLLADGLTDKEIAEKVILAPGTVKWYNKQLYSKLGVHSRTEAVDRGRELGLLDDIETGLLGGTVTFLFTDIEGSTRLWERHPEAMGEALELHDSLLRRAIQEKGGRVFKTVGDAFCAVFDDAVNAISAGHAAQIAILDQDWGETPIRIRIALHTGTAVHRDDDYFGPPVNYVARLLAAAHGEQILVSESAQTLARERLPEGLSLRDLGRHRLRDLDQIERIYQLRAADLPADFPPPNTMDPLFNNLPTQRTSFVGRQKEIAEVKRLLGMNRLLTLTGPPGTGKTRLGLQVAAEVLRQFEDGVYFVELAPISDPALVTNVIAQLCDIRESPGQPLLETLKNYLREKQLLLLIDNFEQVIEAAPLVGELLDAAHGVKALVTSREALRIYGEQEFAVPPMTLPEPGQPEILPVLRQNEAVELFCQRAQAVKADFKLSEENAYSVAELCARLDGLPLAIELAAARSKLLSPENICDRLQSRLVTLTGGARDLPARMRTLRAAIDWSYNLLEIDEQRLLDRLSVFQGGRTIEAVETICGSDLSPVVLDGLDSLLNKNLLYSAKGRTGETRFYMLETIQEYAHDRLVKSGHAGVFELRHARYFMALAERAEAELHGALQEYWYARLTDELENIRTALNWAFDGAKPELGALLVAVLRDFWYFTGRLSESSTWIERALESEGSVSPATWAKTLVTASRLAYARGKHAQGERLARQALSIASDIDDKENQAWALIWLPSHMIVSRNQLEEAIYLAREGLRLFRELDHGSGIIYALNMLGEIARLTGEYDQAGQYYEECHALSKKLHNRRHEAISLANLSYVAYHQGNYDRAIDRSREAVVLLNALKMEYASAIVLAMFAGAIGAKGNPECATRLLAASEKGLESVGARIQPADKPEVDLFKAAVREELGEANFRRAWAEGRAMSFQQALGYALRE